MSERFRLETAIADKREHPEHTWRDKDGATLIVGGLRVYALNTSGGDIYPALDGWTLVVEHKLCPFCGGAPAWHSNGPESRVYCQRCYVHIQDYNSDGEDEAWEEWDRRVSGWHKAEERPPRCGDYHAIDTDGLSGIARWIPDQGWPAWVAAWRDNDVPPRVTP